MASAYVTIPRHNPVNAFTMGGCRTGRGPHSGRVPQASVIRSPLSRVNIRPQLAASNRLLVKWRDTLARAASRTPLALVDLLAANAYLTTKGAAERLGVAFTPAQRGIRRLESLSISRGERSARASGTACTTPRT